MFGILLFVVFAGSATIILSSNETVNNVSEVTGDLALALLRNGASYENAFISPISISTCIGMVYVGSKDETKNQINKFVYGGLPDSAIIKGLKNDSDHISHLPRGYTFNVANRAYSAIHSDILDSYNASLAHYFKSDLVEIDFATDADKARRVINDWVQEKTLDKIKDLLLPKSIDGLTRIVLINAIFFKGDWEYKFAKNETKEEQFSTSENKHFNISMMKSRTDEYYFYQNSDVKVLGLPFVNETMFMYLVLPQEKFGLKKIEDSLDGKQLLSLFDKTTKQTSLTVKVPKFKFAKELPLKDTLIKMNITDMFSSKADLSGIFGAKNLYVSGAFHKAAFEINEDGAEASAASGMSAKWKAATPTFIANQPFLFAIVYRETKSILFFGRFVNDKYD